MFPFSSLSAPSVAWSGAMLPSSSLPEAPVGWVGNSPLSNSPSSPSPAVPLARSPLVTQPGEPSRSRSLGCSWKKEEERVCSGGRKQGPAWHTRVHECQPQASNVPHTWPHDVTYIYIQLLTVTQIQWYSRGEGTARAAGQQLLVLDVCTPVVPSFLSLAPFRTHTRARTRARAHAHAHTHSTPGRRTRCISVR